jgi:hypothetical protein
MPRSVSPSNDAHLSSRVPRRRCQSATNVVLDRLRHWRHRRLRHLRSTLLSIFAHGDGLLRECDLSLVALTPVRRRIYSGDVDSRRGHASCSVGHQEPLAKVRVCRIPVLRAAGVHEKQRQEARARTRGMGRRITFGLNTTFLDPLGSQKLGLVIAISAAAGLRAGNRRVPRVIPTPFPQSVQKRFFFSESSSPPSAPPAGALCVRSVLWRIGRTTTTW